MSLQNDTPQDVDLASLSRLHDIVVPEPLPWWPPAPGWIVLAGLLFLAFAILSWFRWRLWKRDAYRRAALVELDRIGGGEREELASLPALIKRTALAAYPRTEVAPLYGDAWLEFLDREGHTDRFTRGPGRLLLELSFRPGAAEALDAQGATELLALARDWIRRHRPVTR